MPYPTVTSGPGVTREVLSDHPDLMVVAFRFTEGAEGAMHSHPHVQATYVASGRFAFAIDGVEHEIGPGDSLMIPGNAVHGCRCLESGALIDSFPPRRDDFL